jgi:hypothetical protein
VHRLAVAILLISGCSRNHAPPAPDTPVPAPAPTWVSPPPVAHAIFEGGRKPEWQDWGWAKHDDVPSGEARIDLSGWKGWQLVHPSGDVAGAFGGLVFRFRAPAAYGTFLTVHLGDARNSTFPSVPIEGGRARAAGDGWAEAYLPIEELDPDGLPFDRVVFFVTKNVPAGWVSIDKIGLTAAPEGGVAAKPAVVEEVAMSVDCGAAGTPISPLIYGIAYEFKHGKTDTTEWGAGATARRWGGNPSSRYNWQIGNAWNTANDWFFENVDYTGDATFTYRRFLEANRAHGVATALTIPMLGWVAKDTTSAGFPKSQHADQAGFDGYRPEAGNGVGKDGKKIAPGAPTTTSVAAPASFIKQWIEAIVADDKRSGRRSVQQYILDNEPNLWSDTHRDVHPDPVSYDELVSKTIAFGSAIRAADPEAVIAGPAEWGWTNYLYSAEDMKHGVTLRLDRRAHGDKPLVAYYLEQLRDHEKKTGVRVLDVLDLHFYPQGAKVYSQAADRATAELRIRQTRGLWDETYVDESWIKDTVMLIPRMKRWIAENYPGRGISIGEWSFGAEQHASGGLAIAEALGRFGQYGITSAFYWVFPPEGSPAYWAFRAYRNYDSKGGHFESNSIPAKTEAAGTSIFASRSDDRSRVVLIAMNFSADVSRRARIDLGTCGATGTRRVYAFRGRGTGLLPERPTAADGPLFVDLSPQSIVVVEIDTKG